MPEGKDSFFGYRDIELAPDEKLIGFRVQFSNRRQRQTNWDSDDESEQ